MAKTQMLWEVHVMAYRKNAPDGSDATMGYDHRAIVERRILKEDILYEAGIDVSVDDVAGLLIIS